MYKTFGSQWFIKRFSSYQKYLYLDRKSLRNAKRFIHAAVMHHFMTDNKTTQYRENGVFEIKL